MNYAEQFSAKRLLYIIMGVFAIIITSFAANKTSIWYVVSPIVVMYIILLALFVPERLLFKGVTPQYKNLTNKAKKEPQWKTLLKKLLS